VLLYGVDVLDLWIGFEEEGKLPCNFSSVEANIQGLFPTDYHFLP
jgi:hypothetical protein